MRSPVSPSSVLGLVKELRGVAGGREQLAVGGALAAQLAKELARGGDPGAVREGGPESAAAYVHVLAGAPSEPDEALLGRSHRARVPVVVLARQRYEVAHVLPTDVVLVPPGRGFPVDDLARVLAASLGDRAIPLAARLPVLRAAVCRRLISTYSRRNGVVGAAIFVPGVDLPVLTLNQMRMVLRIAAAHGEEISNERVPELLAVLGGGLAFRAVARELLDLVPGLGWAIKGAVAYAGTRALGEAAVPLFASRAAART